MGTEGIQFLGKGKWPKLKELMFSKYIKVASFDVLLKSFLQKSLTLKKV